MNSPGIDTEAAVEVAKHAAGILPEAGQAVVLEHLLSKMTPAALQELSPEARAKLQQALLGTEAAPSSNFIPSAVEIDRSEPGPPSDGNEWRVLPLVGPTEKNSMMGARFVSSEDSSDTTHAGSAGEAWIIRDGENLEVHVPTCVNANIEVQAQRLNSVADYENYGNPFTVGLDGDGHGNATLEVDQSCERLHFLFSDGIEWKVLPLVDPTEKKSVMR